MLFAVVANVTSEPSTTVIVPMKHPILNHCRQQWSDNPSCSMQVELSIQEGHSHKVLFLLLNEAKGEVLRPHSTSEDEKQGTNHEHVEKLLLDAFVRVNLGGGGRRGIRDEQGGKEAIDDDLVGEVPNDEVEIASHKTVLQKEGWVELASVRGSGDGELRFQQVPRLHGPSKDNGKERQVKDIQDEL